MKYVCCSCDTVLDGDDVINDAGDFYCSACWYGEE